MSLRACGAVVAVLLFSLGSGAGASAVTILSGCTDIQKSGFYTLDRDITGSIGSACVEIRDVSDVQLDCHGHSITTSGPGLAALLVQAVKNFTITDCKLPQLSGYSMFIGNSLNGVVTRNEMKDLVFMEPDPTAAGSFRVINNKFSEFGLLPPDPNNPTDDFTGIIPVATGLNQIFARYMIAPALPPEASVTTVAAVALHPRVFPNPWRADRHPNPLITFDNLPADSTIQIFTVSAHWVKTLHASGSTTWDLRNDAGDPTASGLYIYAVTTAQGQKTVGKLTVIR